MNDVNWFLPSTQDSTDRTAEIEQLLACHGICQLGSGIYVVSGVTMPNGTTLRGVGAGTQLLLDTALPAGFTVRLGSFCAVEALTVMGAEEPIELPEQVGERHGIVFEGTATVKDPGNPPKNSMIHGCFAKAFTGGGITCKDTGYGTDAMLTVSDCQLLNCGAGINIAHFSEYHKFTNILCWRCLYGCINNGGNNMFVNCGFSSNVTGFMMDNSQGQSNNNSHGSAIGCTFNHSDSNRGIGILSLGATSGYVFSGCQVFYSKIVLEDSVGLHFDSLNCGRQVEISIKGGSLTMFTDCVFTVPPLPVTVENNDLVKFINCYTRQGEAVDIR